MLQIHNFLCNQDHKFLYAALWYRFWKVFRQQSSQATPGMASYIIHNLILNYLSDLNVNVGVLKCLDFL